MAAIFDESKDVKCNIRERVFQSEISSSFLFFFSFLCSKCKTLFHTHSLFHTHTTRKRPDPNLCAFEPNAATACAAIQCVQLNSNGKVTKLTR